MPEHLIKSFYLAKAIFDNFKQGKPTHLPALKAKDFHNVVMYLRLLRPQD